MDSTRIAHPAPPTTRFERGIALAQEHFEEITRVAPWIWSVPSCSGAGVHAVNLKTGECSCPDRTPAGETDKHVVAARYVKARTATCIGCDGRFRHRDLYDVGEDNLTFFEGDVLWRVRQRARRTLRAILAGVLFSTPALVLVYLAG